MNFDHKEVASVLTTISNEKLLLIDWNIHSKPKNNYVFQDFGKAFYMALEQGEHLFKKYKNFNLKNFKFIRYSLTSFKYYSYNMIIFKFES